MELNDLEIEMFERIANARRALRNQEQSQVLSIWYVMFDKHPEPNYDE